ncbi:MAG: hypothetical protein LBK60_01525 [Verrucomicrobiales bacterium]|jgi:hypothetical protein|nr:hypothetical protein [Verrucomicrobiales bacterium]
MGSAIMKTAGPGPATTGTLRVVLADDSPGAGGAAGAPDGTVFGSVSVAAAWVQLPEADCRVVTIVNDTGVTLAVRRDGGGASLRLPQVAAEFYVQNASQLELARLDGGTDSVTVTYATEK